MIRHAEAEGNLYRRGHGHYDGQITCRGFLQIEQLMKRFDGEKIDAVYSSDLSRACLTADSICAPRGLKLNTDKRLREVNMGVWEDVPWGDLQYNEPEMFAYFGGDPARWRVEGSEGYDSVIERMTECISQTAERHDGETIAVFSHGFAIRAFISAMMGVQSHEAYKVPHSDNTAVALLTYDNKALTIEYQGDNSHLSGEISTFANQTWWRGDSALQEEGTAPKERAWHMENLRYMPLDESRDAELLEKCGNKTQTGLYTGFAVFLMDEPAGLVGLDTNKYSDENAGFITYYFIKPEYSHMGFEIQLIGQAVSVFRKLGRNKLRIRIPAEGEGFYLKHGFANIEGQGSVSLLEKDISLKGRGAVDS